MRRRLATAAGALLAIAASLLAAPSPAQAQPRAETQAAPGFHVTDGRLLDANGKDFVLRGVNHAHTWYPTRTPQALKDIKALGANSVRVVLATGDRWTRTEAADAAAIVTECKRNRLVCVLEAHDTTGYGEQAGAVSLARAVDYWLSIKDVLRGQEKYVVVNLGNEPYGNSGYGTWTSDTQNAIARLREAGFGHTLMVDAPNWGQDWTFTMRDNAGKVFAADPDRNTVFSIHMYGVFDTAAEVNGYLNRFTTQRLPIVVGEFGNDHSDGNPDEDAIMAAAQRLGIGYLGWSWSGNGGGVEYLDMATDFDASRLSTWGQRIFEGSDGIRQTAREASVFTSGPDDGSTGGGCAVSYRLSDWGNWFNADVTIRNTGTTAVKGWQLDFAFPGDQRLNQAWNARATQQGSQVRAANESWTETIPAGGTVSFGFNGSSAGTDGVPASFALNGTSCTTS
ncbi:cellulase family glycosylhydrolase [Streptomyces sp. ID05-47C]|uniref:cellulase family glycosylhydrolase n=1 Tax=Streptomyces sp. ID05-47C TaxID=3028665 RepID=UPI0029BB4820|nr:cellulase family glycosylhydrolase [Streptomyces sp. ID05-47C]MDX3569236.1 cellulase family glycosylhydrolase [Streptomyces sp. ID05-47C]